MKLIPEAIWDINPLPVDFSLYRAEHKAYIIITLVDCSPLEISRSLQWLQSISYQLHFPALFLVDEMTPLILQQFRGTHAIVLAKAGLRSMRESVLLWMNGKLQPRKADANDMSLCAKEWTALNRYLLVQNMHGVAAWMNISTKNAYYWRKRALKKLGFKHINEFLLFTHHVAHPHRH
ncbi:hypothetical protein [Enterobacter sp. UPMP2052]